MPNDPDFHDCADAWLDATGDDGQHRVLREILRDSPDAAGEFAVLARTEAALQLAGLTQSERLQNARKLIQRSVRTGVRRLIARPAFRWSGAAALLIGGTLWLVLRGDDEDSTRPGKLRIAPVMQPAPSVPVRSSPAPDELSPADKDFARRMSRFIIPEFKATRVPLATALDTLSKNIAAIDPAAAPDFFAASDLPEDLTVNLHLKYQPAAVLVDLVAIQTGTVFRATGTDYLIQVDEKTPMPGEMQEASYQIAAIHQFLRRQGLPENETQFVTVSADVIDAALGEKPSLRQGDPDMLAVEGTNRLHAMLRRVTAGETGTPPGTWAWSLRAVEVTKPEAQAQFDRLIAAARTKQTSLNDAEFQAVVRDLAGMAGVDLMTGPTLTPAPGVSGKWFAGEESLDDPEDWTGFRWTLRNEAAGDTGGRFTVDVQVQGRPGNDATQPLVFSKLGTTAQLTDGHTLLLSGLQSPAGREVAVFLTGHKDAAKVDLPYGIPVIGKSGFVHSPYAEDKGMIDVEGLKRGTRVQCPYTQKHFRVP